MWVFRQSLFFFFSSRRRHTRSLRDWSSDVCSSDLDNALRAEALGIRTFVFQSVASAFASVVAALLGGGYALWVRYVNPESALGLQIMLDVLLMAIIGGIG